MNNLSAFELTVVARLLERAFITVAVIGLTIVVLIGFWKRVQKINVEFSQNDKAFKADLIFAMPVFLLIGLILFAYVSFSFPISASHSIPANINISADEPPSAAEPTIVVSGFNGATGGGTTSVGFYLNGLSDAISTLEGLGGTESRTTASILIDLRRSVVFEFYGAEVVDECSVEEGAQFDAQTCRSIRRWLAIN